MNERSHFSFSDYRSFFKAELERRQARNPRYSLRSFARDLGFSAPRLSDVLRGRYGISRAAAFDLATRIRLSEVDRAYLCDLVESEHGRSRFTREAARARLAKAPHAKNSKRFQLIGGTAPEQLFEEVRSWLLEQSAGEKARIEITVTRE